MSKRYTPAERRRIISRVRANPNSLPDLRAYYSLTITEMTWERAYIAEVERTILEGQMPASERALEVELQSRRVYYLEYWESEGRYTKRRIKEEEYEAAVKAGPWC